MLTGAFVRLVLVSTDTSEVEEARSYGLALSPFRMSLASFAFAPSFASSALSFSWALDDPMVRCPAVEARAILIGIGAAVGYLAVGAFAFLAFFALSITFARIGGRHRNRLCFTKCLCGLAVALQI